MLPNSVKFQSVNRVDLSTLSTCQPCRPVNPVDLSTLSTCQPCRPVNPVDLSTCRPGRPLNPVDLSTLSTLSTCQPFYLVDPVDLSTLSTCHVRSVKIVRSGKCMVVLIMFGLLLMCAIFIHNYVCHIYIYT